MAVVHTQAVRLHNRMLVRVLYMRTGPSMLAQPAGSGSNLVRDTENPDWGLCGFSDSLQVNSGIVRQSKLQPLPSTPFKFDIRISLCVARVEMLLMEA